MKTKPKSVKPRKAAAREKLVTVHELHHKTGKIIARYRWPKSLADFAVKYAKENGITFGDVVTTAIRKYKAGKAVAA